jgi:diguanylate cyclase (GGDEF)-like protein
MPLFQEDSRRRRPMIRAGAALFGAAAVITLLSVVLPHQPQIDARGLTVVAAAAGAVAVLLAAAGERLPVWTIHAWPTLGTAFVSFALLFNGERDGGAAGGDEMYYLWVVLFSAYFLGRAATAAQVALIGAAYTVTLVAIDPGPIGVSRWLSTVGLAIGSAVVVRLLSERVDRLVTALRRAASTDPLTGLLNRRAFGERVARELARARRTGEPFALLVADVDCFKAVNDGGGHAAGDAALVAIASTLRAGLRAIDSLARVGGDEFAVLLPATGAAGAAEAAARLTARVAAGSLPAISIGSAAYGSDGHSADDLLRAADLGLYAAKRGAVAARAA